MSICRRQRCAKVPKTLTKEARERLVLPERGQTMKQESKENQQALTPE